MRMVGERVLLGRSDVHAGLQQAPTVAAVGRALVAVGALPEAVADLVIEDYALASSLRSGHGLHGMIEPPPPPVSALPTPRVFGPDAIVEVDGGAHHLRFICLSPDHTRISTTFWADPVDHHRIVPFPPPQPVLTDDRGTSSPTRFTGGGGPGYMRGLLKAERPLAMDSAWIEVGSHRIELAGVGAETQLAVAPIDGDSAAAEHLWGFLFTADHAGRRSDGLQEAVDAMRAAGALSDDDETAEVVRLVIDAMERHPSITEPSPPEPWKTMLERRQNADDGRAMRLALGVATPLFDGIAVAVIGLESTPRHWTVEVDVMPDLTRHVGFEQPRARRRRPAWTAVDDLGNRYLGSTHGFSNSGDGTTGQGEISFSPPLHPDAASVDLVISAATHQATLRIDCAEGTSGR